MSRLFTPITLRQVTVRNRVWVSPMCQYSAVDGEPNDWHLVHLGAFARGGAGLVLTEATAVTPSGRISPEDTGLWNDDQQAAWARIVKFVHDQGATAGIQLAHAGRKASAYSGFTGLRGGITDQGGGWRPVAPSGLPFPGLREDPAPLNGDGIARIVSAFGDAAERAVAIGFDILEVHAAHGYLIHEFLSPLTNHRDDEYGGSFDNRVRLVCEVVREIRRRVDAGVPVVVRLSSTDWIEGGWSEGDTARLASLLLGEGVDLIDCSSGGNAPANIPVGPGYQVPFARRIREEVSIPVGAVGMITEPKQAEDILAEAAADVVLLGRELLRDPHWPLRAAWELGEAETGIWPVQYREAESGTKVGG
ncbi:NADH:flavin oxidoreductase/NADH oxidase [Solicola gregarius]|uniref:NADH:flavin oxidoreductase/NADH oxidase n=1 Tax=Solicola gregarius TaxID=2908642 RepID=A0AA46YMA7_9ACTN|nr:NADH:flavin oxidoreductase/NADH oxidase [Solicola gregarius]UYM06341.1 NADH:flavin oxidoreductase/NADH oxidase [Solicola gregarius]